MKRVGINYRAYIPVGVTSPERADELIQLIDESIDESADREFEYSERISIEQEQYYDGKTPIQRALEFLERPETFPGAHRTARAFLRDCAPTVGIFRRRAA